MTLYDPEKAARCYLNWTPAATGSSPTTIVDVLLTGTPTDITGLADDVMQAASDNKWWSTDLALLSVDAYTSMLEDHSTLGSVTGAGGSGTSPGVCILVNKNVPTAPRKRRGRWFLPGVAEAGIYSNGQLTTGYQAGLQTNMDGFKTDVIASSFVTSLMQWANFGTLVGGQQEGFEIASLAVQGVGATQRRRMRR